MTDHKRREPIVETHDGWTLTITDDQPIADGKEYANEHTVVLSHGETEVRRFVYPSYRIWTLLAHWAEDLPEPPEPVSGIVGDPQLLGEMRITDTDIWVGSFDLGPGGISFEQDGVKVTLPADGGAPRVENERAERAEAKLAEALDSVQQLAGVLVAWQGREARRCSDQPASGVGLSEEERAWMRAAAEKDTSDPRGNDGVAMCRAVERIVAARVAEVERERDVWRAKRDCAADDRDVAMSQLDDLRAAVANEADQIEAVGRGVAIDLVGRSWVADRFRALISDPAAVLAKRDAEKWREGFNYAAQKFHERQGGDDER